jgi:hypothetical protein
MKLRNLAATGLLIAWFTTLPFCGTIPEEHKGAAVGAGLGTVAGVLVGGDTEGRIIGGLIGALVGGAIGHYAYDKPRSGRETADTYGYESSQGTIVTIENVELTPRTVDPGEVVDMKVTYAVLTPSEHERIDITEIRKITHNGELVGNPRVRVTRDAGTYASTLPLRLPPDADAGTYLVTTTIESASSSDVRESRFVVQ